MPLRAPLLSTRTALGFALLTLLAPGCGGASGASDQGVDSSTPGDDGSTPSDVGVPTEDLGPCPDADDDGVCDADDVCEGFDDTQDGDDDDVPTACDCSESAALCLANGATCTESSTGVACVCAAGTYGLDCAGACACVGAALCADGLTGDGTCSCSAGTYGADCLGSCDCVNDGQCAEGLLGDGTCTCVAGTYGADCSGSCACGAAQTCDDGATGDGTCRCNTPGLGACGLACVAGVPDQQNPATGGTRNTASIGQGFTAGVSGYLTGVAVGIQPGGVMMPINVTLLVRNAAGGLLRSEVVEMDPGGHMMLSNPVPVAAGVRYSFFVNAGTVLPFQQTLDTYAGGAGSWQSDRDMVFITLVAPCSL
ncbi:MAG: hypothetical protein KC593_16455 [Myxococcales bacterium]|nr:hypothetical protein [Myxococcales bacterium]